MPTVTLASVRRFAGKVEIRFGKHGYLFNSNADAVLWARDIEDDPEVFRRMIVREAIVRNLIPGGAGGAIGLTLTYTPGSASPLSVTQGIG